MLIYDAQYTPAEYEAKRGWGHSTFAEGARLAEAAGVGRLVLFHHDPGHDDFAVARIEAEARLRLGGDGGRARADGPRPRGGGGAGPGAAGGLMAPVIGPGGPEGDGDPQWNTVPRRAPVAPSSPAGASVLLAVGPLVQREVDLDQLLEQMVAKIAAALAADRGTIYLVDPDANALCQPRRPPARAEGDPPQAGAGPGRHGGGDGRRW